MAKILSIIPYEFYPPRYGGALRCFHLLRELARRHDVSLLTTQPVEDFQNHQVPFFPENVQIVSTDGKQGYRTILNIFPERLANAANSRILKRSLRGKGNLYLLKTYPVLKQLLAENDFDLVLYENLESFTVLHPHIRRLAPRVAHVYDAHNVDSELWLQLANLEANPILKTYAASARTIEKGLHKRVSLCLACSEVDKQKLEELNTGSLNIRVIPNGVDTSARPYDSNNKKQNIANLLFCGTLDYVPNIKGLIWFYENVFPLVRKERADLTLTIVGKMNTPGPYGKTAGRPGHPVHRAS
jgi:polysaccharide biosynthesis protein PslH